MHRSVEQLWQRYCAAHPDAPPAHPPAFYFCDNPKDADLCAALVAAAIKQATAASLAELELAGCAVPQVGDLAIVTDWAGEALALIRTSAVEIRRFGDVDAGFAYDEGEGDRTLEWWRAAHRAYYSRVLAGSGIAVDDDLQIACEWFEVVLRA